MISIDNIGFRFQAEDEEFSRSMYIRWDNYYGNVIRRILEDFFSRYDTPGELLSLDMLQLNLGNIPQEDFYQQFPLRLKEELEKAFARTLGQNGTKESSADQVKRRVNSLSFYLENGFCPTVWEDAEFDPTQEIGFLLLQTPGTLIYLFHDSLRHPKRLRRLMGSILSFVHETQDEKYIRTLAGLLDTVMVRQIINAECENHTEIDVPAYWMHLYNWLIQYYPFNSVYMFGSKSQFKDYLNIKLLHFIRKRPYSTYLSKAELTMQFLIEVFGKEYYVKLLNIIYSQQERNPDGTPVYADYFDMEIYHMFRHLSLLDLPAPDMQPDEENRQPDEDPDHLPLPNSVEGIEDILRLISSISPFRAEVLSRIIEVMQRNPSTFSLLHQNGRDAEEYLSKVLLLFLSDGKVFDSHLARAEDILRQWMFYLHLEDSGQSTFQPSEEMPWQQMTIFLAKALDIQPEDAGIPKTPPQEEEKKKKEKEAYWNENILEEWFKDNRVSTLSKQRLVSHYLSRQSERMLSLVRRLLLHQAVALEEWMQWFEEKEIMQAILRDLSIDIAGLAAQDGKEASLPAAPEYLPIENAGLVLLVPWFPRLFEMLELLDEEKKDFKNMDARIHAIFVIQRLVTFEDREYKEKELAFNRILTECPFAEPLPACRQLLPEEQATVESMLNGVKSNWNKVQHTSVEGFQHSFLQRSGHLEQKEDKWLLTVDTRAYDVLLDSVPWSYTTVRFPWLKKPIQVSWRTTEEF